MKRSEMKDILKDKLLQLYMVDYSTDERAEFLLKSIEESGMLPPKRPDESPVGYGAAYLDDTDVMKNYFRFKHTWEPEDDKR